MFQTRLMLFSRCNSFFSSDSWKLAMVIVLLKCCSKYEKGEKMIADEIDLMLILENITFRVLEQYKIFVIRYNVNIWKNSVTQTYLAFKG